MSITTITSREFNQDVGRAKKAAQDGPVLITDRGRPAHVLLSIDDYRRLTGGADDLGGGSGATRRAGFRFHAAETGPNHRRGGLVMYLLDTNVVSKLRRPERADENVARWAASVASGAFFLSVVTILELELGILRVGRRDAAQGSRLRQWLDQRVLPRFEGRVLPIDVAVARVCARLHVPDRQSERDAMIAATARVHGMFVVTRNVRDFEATGVKLFNPWS